MLARAYGLHTDALALEVGDAVNGVVREQLEAPDVGAAKVNKKSASPRVVTSAAATPPGAAT
jgi:hypothetical protein